jgi:ATPase subunit of ABC transporter with duplicated ATPase domains
MTDDLKIIKQLEKQTGRELKKRSFDEIMEVGNIGFSIDEKGQVTGLNLEKPPIEIIKQGKEAIRAYFKSLEGKKQTLNEVKVLLVGDGGAGKTSLVKRLLNQGFDKNEDQTHGINIRQCKVKLGKVNIIAHIWDFGGQEIMHASHQFFLSKRSLYILVLDGRKDHKVEYWLKHIES